MDTTRSERLKSDKHRQKPLETLSKVSKGKKKNLKWTQVLGNLKDVRITNKGCTHPSRAKLMELIPVVLTGSDTVHCEVTTIFCLYPVGEKSMPIINYDQPRARIQTPQFTLDITSMLPYFQQQFIM